MVRSSSRELIRINDYLFLPLALLLIELVYASVSLATPQDDEQLRHDTSCIDCHPAEVAAWQASPMGSSFKLIDEERLRLTQTPTLMNTHVSHPRTSSRYSLKVTDHQVIFTQSVQALEISRPAYGVIGGHHARTYLWKRQSSLFEAPLTLYGDRWDLSPGYAERDRGLTRAILPGCLHCHTEPVQPKKGTKNAYMSLPKRGITCARCHGDGREHARAHYAGKTAPIINPSVLSPTTRQAVCDQCHFGGAIRLLREGKSYHDYQPGEDLADTIAIFVREGGTDGLSSVSHRDRLDRSACAQKSPTMTCTTCHQPHAVKRAAPNDSCITCHQGHRTAQKQTAVKTEYLLPTVEWAVKEAHSLASERAPSCSGDGGDNCVGCHMRREGLKDVPHLSTLDHWIRKRPLPEPLAKNPSGRLLWTAFPEINPSSAEHQILLGRAYWMAWRQDHQTMDVRRAYLNLTSGLTNLPQSLEGWVALAQLASEMSERMDLPELQGEVGYRLALEAARRAYSLDPIHADNILLLSSLEAKGRRPDLALKLIDRQLQVDPKRVDLLRRKARLLRSFGMADQAKVLSEEIISLDPFDVLIRFDLALDEQRAQHWSAARDAYQLILTINPTWREAWLNLGWVEFQAQQYASALTAFSKGEEGAQGTLLTQALSGQALSFDRMGQTQEAERIALRAYAGEGSAPGIAALLGQYALERGDLRVAVERLQQASHETPRDHYVWWSLAKAYEKLGHRDQAREMMQRSAALGYGPARQWLTSDL